METVTTRVDSDTYDEIRERSGDERSKSAVTRGLIEKGLEAEEIEAERDRLNRHLQQLIQQREEHDELVEYVEHERTLQERRRQREEMKDSANILQRFKWTLTGMPAPDEGGQ